MYFNFSLVSGVIKQAVSIFLESPLCAKNWEDFSREKSIQPSQAARPTSPSPPQGYTVQLLRLPGAVCLNHP